MCTGRLRADTRAACADVLHALAEDGWQDPGGSSRGLNLPTEGGSGPESGAAATDGDGPASASASGGYAAALIGYSL